MVGLFDIISVVKLLVQFEIYEPIISIIDLLLDDEFKQEFARNAFISAIQFDQYSFAV